MAGIDRRGPAGVLIPGLLLGAPQRGGKTPLWPRFSASRSVAATADALAPNSSSGGRDLREHGRAFAYLQASSRIPPPPPPPSPSLRFAPHASPEPSRDFAAAPKVSAARFTWPDFWQLRAMTAARALAIRVGTSTCMTEGERNQLLGLDSTWRPLTDPLKPADTLEPAYTLAGRHAARS